MDNLVICDAGPLIALAKLNYLSILKKLFTQAFVPETVLKECLINPIRPDAQAINEALEQKIIILKKASLTNSLYEALNLGLLDDGEREAIILAKEYQAKLLIDEKQGRKIAKNLSIKVIGIVGLLLVGHEQGLISNIQDCFTKLQNNNYRLSQHLIEGALKRVKRDI